MIRVRRPMTTVVDVALNRFLVGGARQRIAAPVAWPRSRAETCDPPERTPSRTQTATGLIAGSGS